ncbi:Ankyrin repeat-containing domain protein, partial [Rhypophila sp. PSN 637]
RKKSNEFPALCSLTRVSRRLHDIFEPILYKFILVKKRNRLSALVWGAEFGRLGTVQKALQYGEDVDFMHERVIFPLGVRVTWWLTVIHSLAAGAIHHASSNGFDEIVQCLLDHGASLTTTAQGLCACRGLLEDDMGTPPLLPSPRHSVPGWYPLHLALCRKHSSTAELLLRHGAPFAMEAGKFPPEIRTGRGASDINKQFRAMFGAIHTAAAFGHHTLLPLMVQKTAERADGGWVVPESDVPFTTSIALVHKPTDIVNRRGYAGYPLHYAAVSSESNAETLRVLVKLGADIDKTYNYNEYYRMSTAPLLTPLGAAVRQCKWESVFTLLELGAEIAGIQRSRSKGAIEDAANTLRHAVYPVLPFDGGPQHRSGDHETWREQRNRFVRRLVERCPGIDLNSSIPQHYSMRLKITSLLGLCAVSHLSEGHWRTVKGLAAQLIQCGADANHIDAHGATRLSLLMAVYADHVWGGQRRRPSPTRYFPPHDQSSSIEKLSRIRDSIVELLQHGAIVQRPEEGLKVIDVPITPYMKLKCANVTMYPAIMLLNSNHPRLRLAGLKIFRLVARHEAKQAGPDRKQELERGLGRLFRIVRQSLAFPSVLYTGGRRNNKFFIRDFCFRSCPNQIVAANGVPRKHKPQQCTCRLTDEVSPT